MSSSTPTSIQPGWYEDPQAPGMLRWFDGITWSPFTKPHAAVARPAAVPQPRTAPAPAHTLAAARAALLAADSGPIPIVATALAAQPAPVDPPAPVLPRRAATSAVPAARPTQVPAPARPAPTETATPVTTASATTAATDRLAAIASSVAVTWPAATTAAVPVPAAAGPSPWAPVEEPPAEPGEVRGPTGLRQLVGNLAENLPAWLPPSIAEPLSLRMVRYAIRTDRFRDRLTAESLKRLVLPEETAWQASAAACLGVLTIALSVWPVAGFGAWLVTCAFAGLAFRRLRQEVLLGGAERAWFGIACGVGPLWTGLLALAFR